MKRLLLILALTTACGGPIPPPQPPTPPVPLYCLAPHVHEVNGQPVVGAKAWVDNISKLTDENGYAYLVPIPAGVHTLHVEKDNYVPYAGDYNVSSLNCDLPITLTPTAPPLPPTKSRDEIGGVNITFQGLEVETAQYGKLPWFEAALFSLTPEDRQRVYAAKRAAGDTHAIIQYDHNPRSLYDEPGQPYQQMNGAAFADHPEAFLEAIKELLRAGFVPMVFMGGDDGERGYVIANNDLGPLLMLLAYAPERDLRQDVLIIPGWDGVFYGWTPEHIKAFGEKFRMLAPNGYLGIEHSSGHIPTGEGDHDWVNGGAMTTYDVILSEFDFPDTTTGGGNDTVWQILARLLGPVYRRGPDQPATDDPGAPFGPNAGQYYLRQGNPRGPYFEVCFEWVGEYYFVRGQQTVADQTRFRKYLKDRGCKWTG